MMLEMMTRMMMIVVSVAEMMMMMMLVIIIMMMMIWWRTIRVRAIIPLMFATDDLLAKECELCDQCTLYGENKINVNSSDRPISAAHLLNYPMLRLIGQQDKGP